LQFDIELLFVLVRVVSGKTPDLILELLSFPETHKEGGEELIICSFGSKNSKKSVKFIKIPENKSEINKAN